MIKIYGKNRISGEEKIIETVPSIEAAEKFCEEWGWIYSDENGHSWWLSFLS